MPIFRISFAVLALVVAVPACSNDSPRTPKIIEVSERQLLQPAVDEASPGDIIVVAPAVRNETVLVDTPDLTIRGVDRNTVVFDGDGKRLTDGFVVRADGVTIENLTVRNYSVNGVQFNGQSALSDDVPLVGFAARYITAYNNGLYGLYAFQAENGVFEQSYTSGHPDSGVYVGQCSDCRTVVDGVTSEFNAVGFESVNASGVTVVRSTFRSNRVGMTPNSQAIEKFAPQQGATIVGNVVADNDDARAPEQAQGAFGIGIVIGGGNTNSVQRNLISGNPSVGVAVTVLDGFDPSDNVVTDNVVTGNGVDLGFWLTAPTTTSRGNCFAGNTFSTSSPASIESVLRCKTDVAVEAKRVPYEPSPQRVGTLSPEPGPMSTSPLDPRRSAAPPVMPLVEVDSVPLPSP